MATGAPAARADALLELATLLVDDDPRTALDYAERYRVLCRELGRPDGEYRAADLSGQAHETLGAFDRSRNDYQRALADPYLSDPARVRDRLSTLNRLAITELSADRADTSIAILTALLPRIESAADTNLWIKALNNLGNAWLAQSRPDLAGQRYIDAYRLIELTDGSQLYRAVVSSNICKTMIDSDNCDTGIPYCRLGAKYAADLSNYMRATAVANLAACLFRQGKHQSVIDTIGHELARPAPPLARHTQLQVLANAHYKLGRLDSAEVFHRRALAVARSLNRVDLQRKTLSSLVNDLQHQKLMVPSIPYAEEAIALTPPEERHTTTYANVLTYLINARLWRSDQQSARLFGEYIDLEAEIADREQAVALREINERFQTTYRRDSISRLTERSETAELLARSRNRNQWLLLGLAGLLGVLAFVLYRISGSRRRYAEQLADVNARLTHQNAYNKLLLTRLNHTTGNYLSSLVNFLKLQRRRLPPDSGGRQLADGLERQILVFTRLQQERIPDSTTVPLAEFVAAYLTDLTQVYQATGTHLAPTLDLPRRTVDTGWAGNFGVLLEELVHNSVKYARRDETGRLPLTLQATLTDHQRLHVSYTDGGAAPAAGPPVHSTRQGVGIVRGITVQLDGEILHYATGGDYRYEAIFELPANPAYA